MTDGYRKGSGQIVGNGISGTPHALPRVEWVPIATEPPLFGIGSVIALTAAFLGAWGLLAWASILGSGKLMGSLRNGLSNLFRIQSTQIPEQPDVLPFGVVNPEVPEVIPVPDSGLGDTPFALICVLLLLVGLWSIGRSLIGVFKPSEIRRLRCRTSVIFWLILSACISTLLLETSAAVFIFSEDLRSSFLIQLFLCVIFTSSFLFMLSRDAPNQLCTITVYGRNELYHAECMVQLSVQAHLATSSAMQNLIGKIQNYGGKICTKLNEISNQNLKVLARSLRGDSQFDRGWDSAIDTRRFSEIMETLVSSFGNVSGELRTWLTKLIIADLNAEFSRPGLVICDVQSVVIELASEIREEYRNIQQIRAKQAEGGIQLEIDTVKATLMNQKMRASDDKRLYALHDRNTNPSISHTSEDRRLRIERERLIEEITRKVGLENSVIDDQATCCRLQEVLGDQTRIFIHLIKDRGGVLTHASVQSALVEMLNQPKIGD